MATGKGGERWSRSGKFECVLVVHWGGGKENDFGPVAPKKNAEKLDFVATPNLGFAPLQKGDRGRKEKMSPWTGGQRREGTFDMGFSQDTNQ